MKPADLGYRMPAEWAPHAGCWMAWPNRVDLWRPHIEGARDDYARAANAAAVALLEPAVRNNAIIYTPATIRARFETGQVYSMDEARLYTRAWQRFSTGQ